MSRPKPAGHGLVAGIIVAAVGIVAVVLGLFVVVAPFGLFLLGGGGDTEGFEAFARAFRITGGAIALFGLLVLVLGVVFVIRALVLRSRDRRATPHDMRR